MDPLLFAIIVVACVLAAWVAFRIVRATVTGAVAIFVYASEQGFLGLAAYFAMWVFLFPVMLIGSFLVGAVWRTSARLVLAEDRQSAPEPTGAYELERERMHAARTITEARLQGLEPDEQEMIRRSGTRIVG